MVDHHFALCILCSDGYRHDNQSKNKPFTSYKFVGLPTFYVRRKILIGYLKKMAASL